MARSIAGLFPDRQSAERAIEDLKTSGFNPAKIGIVMRDKAEAKAVTAEHGTHSTEGAVAGGIIGGTAGALLAAVGALVIPGVGPFISGGILVSLIGGTAGWLVGGLAGLGIPEDEARYYEDQVQQGRALVTVDAEGRDGEARAIMLRDGAEDLQAQGYGGGLPDQTAYASAATAATTPVQTTRSTVSQEVDQTGDIRVPVREEELVVGKRAEEQGRVHIHKEVTETPQSVDVSTQHERVTVERVAFSGDVNADDAFVERSIDVPLMGEEAVVGKQVRGVEEVVIHKDVTTEQQRVTDTVRKERVVVDGVDQNGTSTTRDVQGTTRIDETNSRTGR